MSFVGRSLRRFEDGPLIAGHGLYTADLAADRILRFVRSPVAAGRIVAIRAPRGVPLVTGQDLAHLKPLRPVLHRPDYVAVAQPIIPAERVRFAGEPIAAVFAATAEEAEDMADAVEVEIEADEPVVDVADALRAGAPAVHPEAPHNILVEGRFATPGVEAALRGAAILIEAEIVSHRQAALPLEPRAAHAAYDRASGRIVLTASTQMPHVLRTAIADVLGMPEGELRVIAPDVGGGFGQKMSMPPEYAVAVHLARKHRLAFAWREDRQENLVASHHSRDQRHAVRGGFDADGRLVGLEAEIDCNVGAYSCYPVTCGVEPLMAMAELPGPYAVSEYRCRARGVATNTCVMAPYRGVSRPAITLSIERLMDKAAARLGLDAVEIRRRNLITRFPHTSPTKLVFDAASYLETMEDAVAAADLPAFRARQAAARREGRYLGVGLSVFSERTGYGTPAFAARGMAITPGWEQVEVSMDPSGFVELRIGASPHGQGLRTTLAQIAADALGVGPERIRVTHGDTDRTPYGWGTFTSRSLVTADGATLMAGRRLAEKLTRIAADMLEAAAGDISLESDLARVRGTDRAVPLAEVARRAYHQTHRMRDEEPGLTAVATYDPAGTFSNACHIAFVEVDVETGGTRVDRFLVAEDAGRLINPVIVDGQIHGGVAQGVANALYEEIVHSSDGVVLTATLADFLVPTLAEVPPIEIHHRVTLSEATVTGAKGIGEGGLIGAVAAVANAVTDALSPFGVEVDEVPATPARLRALIAAAQERQA